MVPCGPPDRSAADAAHARFHGFIDVRRAEDIARVILAAASQMAVPLFDRRADLQQRLRQVDHLLQLLIEGEKIEIGIPHADPLILDLHCHFQHRLLASDLGLRLLALGDIGDDIDDAAVRRRRGADLEYFPTGYLSFPTGGLGPHGQLNQPFIG